MGWPHAKRLPEIALTRGGLQFNPNDDIWHWTESVFRVHINFSTLPLTQPMMQSLKWTLATLARIYSPKSLVTTFFNFKHFVLYRKHKEALSHITLLEISSYATQLEGKKKAQLGRLNTTLQKWVALGLDCIDSEVATYLQEQRKPGSAKGEPVRTRDPFIGPFSESEYTALYKAVDAAYGSELIPRWAAVLTRLLFACGGRISQYASLKIMDLKDDGILKLPQVKQGTGHSREVFKDFDISPQTQDITREYISDLKSQGFDDSSALFPDRIVLRQPVLDKSRRKGDIFAGHCRSSQLSDSFTREISPVAPPTERLGYAPTPINSRRFRYTFGTRLVEEGASLAVVADRLGHSDLQNVGNYFEASPKIVENIDRAMDAQLAPLAAAFRGRLIEGEALSTHRGAPGSRIIDFRVSAQPLASCAGKGQGCSFNKPVACYTCFKFEPWLDAAHEKVLARLEAERDRHLADERMARINDDAILAVRQVIAECSQAHARRRGASAE